MRVRDKIVKALYRAERPAAHIVGRDAFALSVTASRSAVRTLAPLHRVAQDHVYHLADESLGIHSAMWRTW
jgi:hypothetical protein